VLEYPRGTWSPSICGHKRSFSLFVDFWRVKTTSAAKTFTSRPRTEGLWVRLKFKDNEVLEGMMPNDLSQTTAEGFLINPPDLRSNTQRIFIPRTALESLTVIAVIGATRRRKRGSAHRSETGVDV